MADSDNIELQRNISAELRKQDDLLESMGKRYAYMNSLGKIASDIAKDKMAAEDRIAALENSIEKKTKNLIELEDLRNINIKERGNLGNEIKKEQLEYLKLIQQETTELNKQKALLEQHQGKLLLLNKIGMKGLVDKAKEFQLIFKTNPIAIAALASLAVLVSVFEIFKHIDEAAADFRKSMGLTRDDSVALETMARSIAIDYKRLGVSAKDAFESIHSIAESVGSSAFATKSITKNMALFQAQLGISTKTSAQFLKIMALVGNTTMHAQKDMLFFAQHMSSAAGVPLDAVMSDIAEASATSYQFLSRNPLELVKASVEARRMGTSLEAATKSSASLLNFTESVKSEMEASVLVGKGINLQKARELAYNRNIRGLNQEILRIAKQTDFTNLDPFQQDAVARALGKSASEIATMVQSEKERVSLMSHMTAEQRAQYKLYEDTLHATDKTKKNYEDIARHQLTQMGNQAALKAISEALAGIMGKLGERILPYIADILQDIAIGLNKINGEWISWVGLIAIPVAGLYTIFRAVKMLNGTLEFLGKPMITFRSILAPVGGFFARIFAAVTGMGRGVLVAGNALKVVMSIVSKILLPLIFAWNIFKGIKGLLNDPVLMGTKGFFAFNGQLILRAIGVITKALWDTIDSFLFGLPGALVRGIASVGSMMSDSILAPFKTAWAWLGKTFLGQSPSQLGLMIVDGLIQVESLIIRALLSPFKKAWEMIKSLPLVSHFFGAQDIASNALPEHKAMMSVDRPKNDVDAKKATNTLSDNVSGMGDEMAKRMGAIVDAINALRDDMKNGTLTANVYLDSQKLDSALGRRVSYTGPLT